MKKTAFLTLLTITLLNTSLSHTMNFNPETKAFHSSAQRMANKTGSAAYMLSLREDDLTPIQEFLTLPAPEKTNPTIWIFINKLFKQMLNFDRLEKTVNRANPQTGNTALGDLITHCHPTHNYVHHMTKDLIKAGARLDNIDSQGNSFGDLLAKARESGALTPNQYSDIAAIPQVQQHMAQVRETRAHGVSEILGLFLPPVLHPTVKQYDCNFPE